MPDSEIQALLELDSTCTHRSYLLLRGLRPSAPECFDLAARVYAAMHSAFDESGYEREHSETFQSTAQTMGLSLRELAGRVTAEPDNAGLNDAKAAISHLNSRQAQRFVFQLAWRSFRWAATDLRRFRLTTVYGFQRQQAEAVGLMAVFRDEPEVATQWLLPTLKKRRLFSQLQPKVKVHLDSFQLRWAYDHGSAASMHATFASGAGATKFSASSEHHLTVEILDDEVDDADPYMFHLAVGSCLRTQERTLKAVMVICPDIVTPPLSKMVETFAEAVGDIWWTLNRRYGARVAEGERRLRVRNT